MPEIPDSEFEKIFRKSAQKLNPEFKPEAWDEMEKLLDKEDRKVFWWRTGIAVLILIFVGVGSGLLYKHYSDKSTNNEHKELKVDGLNKRNELKFDSDNENSSKNSSSNTYSNSGEKNLPTENKKLEDSSPSEKIDNLSSDLRKPEESVKNKEGTNKPFVNILPEDKVKDNKSKKDENPEGEYSSNSNNKNTKSVGNNNKAAYFEDPNSGKDDTKSSVRVGGTNKKDAIFNTEPIENGLDKVEFPVLLPIRSIYDSGLLDGSCPDCIKIDSIDNVENREVKEGNEIPNTIRRRMIAGVTVAPDFSGVGLGSFDGVQTGRRTSFALDYAISDRFYVTTGLVLSKKVYRTKSSEYSVRDGYWNGAGIPERIDADCDVLEIPLGFRYDFAQNSKRRWFAQSSITSFWMLKEFYEYKYESNYNPPLNRRDGWEGENENKHLWSVAQFGIGYERTISKKFSFQVAPFLQAPLGGIGHGNVKLFSFGTEFTLRYSFLHK